MKFSISAVPTGELNINNELKNMHILWNDKRLINKKSTHLI